MKATLKTLFLSLGLVASVSANAAIYNLGTVVTQTTKPVFDFNISGEFGDSYTFNVDTPFAFTSSVDGFNMIGFNTALSGNGLSFAEDSNTPITGLSNAFRSSITEKLLGAGSYTFNVGGSAAGGMYTGSFTVGRPAVSAVPEADTLALMMFGFSLFGLKQVRNKKARA